MLHSRTWKQLQICHQPKYLGKNLFHQNPRPHRACPYEGNLCFCFCGFAFGEQRLENLVPVVEATGAQRDQHRVFGVFASDKSPKFSGAFGANRTWCILEKVPKFWIFGLSLKATPFAKYPKIILELGSNNYLFFI